MGGGGVKSRGDMRKLCSGTERRGCGVDENRGGKTPGEGGDDEGNCSQLLANDTFANNHPSEVRRRHEYRAGV